MKANIRILLFLTPFILMVSCQKEERLSGIPINIHDVVLTVRLSQLVAIDSIIPISNGDFLDFGIVKRSFLMEGNILLHTSMPSTLTLINRRGEMINQYQPDHLLNDITSVVIIEDVIHVLDRSSMQVHLFDMDLKYKGFIDIPVYAQSFMVLPDQKLSLYVGNEVSGNAGKLITYDLSVRKVIRDELKISENQRRYFNFLTTYHYFQNNNNLFFWESSVNNIYQVLADKNVEVAYTLDYGPKGVEAGYYDKAKYANPYEFVSDMRAKGYHHRHFKMLANDTYLFMQFDQGDQFASAIYDFETSRTISFNDIHDDLFANSSMEEIELSFFTSFEGSDTFMAFIPFEYLEDKGLGNLITDATRNYMVMGKIAF